MITDRETRSISRSSDHGFITDASTYGVRLDYAVAANLNAYATFLYASRVSQGYGWGWIRPDPEDLVFPALQYGNNGTANNLGFPSGNLVDLSFAIGAPNILERDLGYEIGGGFDWKLIEGYTLAGQGGLLEARRLVQVRVCGQETTQLGHTGDRDNMWGINPNREIDPIFGTRVTIEVDF